MTADPNAGYKRFLTAAASAPEDGYTVYWLGREFQAGGLTFRGPSVDEFGTEVEEGGVQMSYGARTAQGGGVGLTVTLYSDAAWQARNARARLPANAIKKAVSINGATGDLILVPAGTRPVNDIRLYIRLGDTWVLALAGAGGPATPGGPEGNPLIDEQTFLSVMRQLRPYPQ